MLQPVSMETLALKVDGMKIARGAQERLNRAKQATPSPVFRPLVYKDAEEARFARHDFEAQPDHEQQLASVFEELNELFEMEAELLEIVNDKIPQMSRNDAAHARRKILGYEEKRKPSLPGMLDEKYHVPGTLDRTRDKIAAIEGMLPRLRVKAAQYIHVRESLKPWPWSRINRERTAELEMNLVMNGDRVQRRGPRDMTGYNPLNR
jgi:hypothetical protein